MIQIDMGPSLQGQWLPERGDRVRLTKVYAGTGNPGDVVTILDAVSASYQGALWPSATFITYVADSKTPSAVPICAWVEFEPEIAPVSDTDRPPALVADDKLRGKVSRQRRELARLNRQARINRLELQQAVRTVEDLTLDLIALRRALRSAEAQRDA